MSDIPDQHSGQSSWFKDTQSLIKRNLYLEATRIYYGNIGDIYRELWPDGTGAAFISAGLFSEPPEYDASTPTEELHAIMLKGHDAMKQKLIADLHLETLEPGETVVELGFGYGQKLLEMALRRPDLNFIGVNIAEDQINHVQRLLEQQNINNVQIINADMSNLRGSREAERLIQEGSVSRVICSEAMFHTRHSDTLSEIARILRPGGEFVVTTITNGGENKRELTSDEDFAFRTLGSIQEYFNLEKVEPGLIAAGIDLEIEDLSQGISVTMPLTLEIFERVKNRINPAKRTAIKIGWAKLNEFYSDCIGYIEIKGRKN